MQLEMRVAHPTADLAAATAMYRDGLGFEILGAFEDHAGFDGVMLGHRGWGYHLELTHHRGGSAGPAPSRDNLLVFYIPDEQTWLARCDRMRTAGFTEVRSFNPYWDQLGKTFEDLDGYRVVLQRARWEP